jgi:hypothetical protein
VYSGALESRGWFLNDREANSPEFREFVLKLKLSHFARRMRSPSLKRQHSGRELLGVDNTELL